MREGRGVAAEDQIVDELVQLVLSRLSPQAIAETAPGCRTVFVEKESDRVRYMIECGADRLGLYAASCPPDGGLARYIDHTLLKAAATPAEIKKLCEEAARFGFAAVCVNPVWVALAAKQLRGTRVAVCTVAGFPLGASTTEVKAYEARRAVFDGATEIDMVINIGALKSGDDDLVGVDIESVVGACHSGGALCKVILETALLSDDEKLRGCELAQRAGADFVKTSTGFGPGGATAEDVRLMRRAVGPRMGIKAAGGIKDKSDTEAMLGAGATRIGASAGVKIVQGETAPAGSY